MDNVIQHYDWGSRTALHELFGFSNMEQQPQAEVWMGTHPNGCSLVSAMHNAIPLSELIKQHPSAILSKNTAATHGDLPFLFKILAADQALSIQVHPNKLDAEKGFACEEKQGVPRNAFNRNYKDANHKPELIYALTDYQAMNGFRVFDEIIAEFRQCDIPELRKELAQFENQPNPQGLSAFFVALLTLTTERKLKSLGHLIAYADRHRKRPIYQLILTLTQQYPNDVGLFAPLLLNVITLKPGEAMFLDARTPHAYIRGTGLEIMANSDNVLRAGLTPKHIDVSELIKCTDFKPKPLHLLRTQPQRVGCELQFSVPVDDFKFSVYQAPKAHQVTLTSAEIVMPIDDTLTVFSDEGERLVLDKGQSVFVPAYLGRYTMTSFGRVARAFH